MWNGGGPPLTSTPNDLIVNMDITSSDISVHLGQLHQVILTEERDDPSQVVQNDDDEIIRTPESDESDDSDTDFEDYENEEGLMEAADISIRPPSFSLMTLNDTSNPSVPDPGTPPLLQWNWVNDESESTPDEIPFTGEAKWQDLHHTGNYELSCFLEFFTAEIQNEVATQTNKFFEQVKNAVPGTRSRQIQRFKPVTNEDIIRLIATRICMGLDEKPKQSDYWAKNPFYKSEIVPQIMTSERYKQTLRFLHFSNNEQQPAGDRLYKIRTIWDMVMDRTQTMFKPGRNICVDESLVLYKGHLFFKQYIPSKASKFGIKVFEIGDSETGYLLNSVIYQGAGHVFSFSSKTYGFGGAVALHLAELYFNAGRCLFVDNYFTNAGMAKLLLEKKTNICGTLRKNLKTSPKMTGRLAKGNATVYSANGILVERWRDKKEVRIITTGKKHEMIPVTTKSGVLKIKPQTVLDYNKNARAIDLADMVMGANCILRKTTKWYKKLFFRLIDICLLNARIMFNVHHPNTKLPMVKFKENVVRQILLVYGAHEVKRGRRSSHAAHSRLQERHFPSKVPVTPTSTSASRECVVCRKKNKRSQTRFMCKNCDVGLCVTPCFETYHTVLSF